ncbi:MULTISPECIES: CinA family protein [Ectothiorhodospira]|uniref:Nicotinamide-nucleotide amidase n=1 Tax=Ectothiorhodospira marina TaxID=1396821 RepID=A0A1H7KWL8_9GAMM|nr:MULTISPECIES: CinA family protein [Ectothiorhodospira]MCG5516222.1 CinA family protein [Ectothiorhodospira sp. 9100]MCG5519625.1 CinA family protein [Ectothiorhodospira sp. 9905]SEK90475.1 nicotinamide-nucleotide amidase [Ectothiorhodospira marina]
MISCDDAILERRARVLGDALLAHGWQVALAESCTGGWIAKVMTDIPGSSAWFDRGFVTYSNAAKREQLQLSQQILDTAGAVSRETVQAMVEGVFRHCGADLAAAVSGIAGPGGGTPAKPVGTVWVAWGARGRSMHAECLHLNGGREAIRRQTVARVLEGLQTLLESR